MPADTTVHHTTVARISRSTEAKGVADHRAEMLAELKGRVAEVGASNGLDVGHYPHSVTEVVAIEPESHLRKLAAGAVGDAQVPLTVVDGTADALPVKDASCDAAVCSPVLCLVADQDAALTEVRRVLRPGGELHSCEHVLDDNQRYAPFQRIVDVVHPYASGGASRLMARTTRQTAPQRTARRKRLAVAVATTVASGAAIWTAVVIAGRDDDPQPSAVAGDPGVSHVHGLGVNPADGALIVATHYGSFRIPASDDAATRIGDSFQDTMGFTVAGPDHFLGSGHPDVAGMQAGQPTRLGLIESTDGGETWTAVSLSGEVDFHALAFAHDQVYGWDSGTSRFMVSTDRHDWETRSTVDLVGFAVDPAEAEHVIGASDEGLIESTDGGRTWDAAEGPRLATVSWHPGTGLWGAEPNGAVWRREGVNWERASALPGEPQAFLATGDGLFAAVHGADGTTGIYRSADDGRTWDLRYRDRQQ